MPKTVALDQQIFEDIRVKDLFYVDKTGFLRDWWTAEDTVTLILRPRRFGKTLMLSTVEQFLSTRYAGRSDLFEGLEVWKDEAMRPHQGTVPVISLSFADIKRTTMKATLHDICDVLKQTYRQWENLTDSSQLTESDYRDFMRLKDHLGPSNAVRSLKRLCELILKATDKRSVILLDEYDTPMIEAWKHGFWNEAADFMRCLLNATFKTNPFLERGLMTGFTRIGEEPAFSDLNNLNVCSVTDSQYMTSFGFTEDEVFAAMDERGLTDREGVKSMYEGFTFGTTTGIYNPWSITSYLKHGGEKRCWWARSNELVSELIRYGSIDLKQQFMELLKGGTIQTKLEDSLVFSRLATRPSSVWTLLTSAGYLKPVSGSWPLYDLSIVNGEVSKMFDDMVHDWFDGGSKAYTRFLEALLVGDLEKMNTFMNEVAFNSFSLFDTGGSEYNRSHKSNTTRKTRPENFYHCFVLGLLVDLRDSYILTSNLDGNNGCYNILLEPRNPANNYAFILDFKVHTPNIDKYLKATVASAPAKIEEKHYDHRLIDHGIPDDHIKKYGFVFLNKKVLIGEA